MGDRLTIRVVSKDNRPVSSILTLTFKDTVTYKYGCSDERFNNLGGTSYLFWKVIQEAKDEGMIRLDLGRSELENFGLTQFKDRLGANRADLTYYRIASGPGSRVIPKYDLTRLVKRLVGHMPNAALIAAGRLFYRHIG
jgi:lipid II:glycine glycyltransferase (peptidoglycan interpeptide bridge formation enzyme)